MIIADFFIWWYGRGWHGVLLSSKRRFRNLIILFSAPSLLRTLFAPWRRIMTPPGASLETHMRALGDNLVSRSIGFIIRTLVLLAACVSIILLAAAEAVWFAIWPLLPAAAFGLIVWGFV